MLSSIGPLEFPLFLIQMSLYLPLLFDNPLVQTVFPFPAPFSPGPLLLEPILVPFIVFLGLSLFRSSLFNPPLFLWLFLDFRITLSLARQGPPPVRMLTSSSLGCSPRPFFSFCSLFFFFSAPYTTLFLSSVVFLAQLMPPHFDSPTPFRFSLAGSLQGTLFFFLNPCLFFGSPLISPGPGFLPRFCFFSRASGFALKTFPPLFRSFMSSDCFRSYFFFSQTFVPFPFPPVPGSPRFLPLVDPLIPFPLCNRNLMFFSDTFTLALGPYNPWFPSFSLFFPAPHSRQTIRFSLEGLLPSIYLPSRSFQLFPCNFFLSAVPLDHSIKGCLSF